MKLNIILILICIVLIILFLVKINNLKEQFQDSVSVTGQVIENTEYPMKINSISNLSDLKLFNDTNRKKCLNSINNIPRNIFVGNKSEDQINPQASLNTNDTIFIQDGIKLTNQYRWVTDIDDLVLDIDTIKAIKYLPYNFSSEICIGNSCVDKNHIKLLKGRTPFSINTYTNIRPFQAFSEKDFSGWQQIYNTDPQSDINIQGGSMKSLKITSPYYKATLYELPNFQGLSKEYDGTEFSDLTGFFPNGVKSIAPTSKRGILIQNSCLTKFNRFKSIPTGIFESYGPIPCDDTSDPESRYFYIVRDDLISEHTHNDDPDGIHMHDHPGNVIIHDSDEIHS